MISFFHDLFYLQIPVDIQDILINFLVNKSCTIDLNSSGRIANYRPIALLQGRNRIYLEQYSRRCRLYRKIFLGIYIQEAQIYTVCPYFCTTTITADRWKKMMPFKIGTALYTTLFPPFSTFSISLFQLNDF